jgi:type IV secretory pathway TraG/TraD family ATPase VirD4
MSEQIREINWFRSWPGAYVFSMMAVVLAVGAGAGAEAWAFREWTPLAQVYLKSYVASAIIGASPLAGEGSFDVLVTGPRHWAEQEDLDAGKSAAWSTVRVRYRVWEEWLRVHVFEGRTVTDLLRPAAGGVIAGLVLLLPLGVWLDVRRARRRRDGIVLRGARLVSRRTYNLIHRKASGIGWHTAGEQQMVRVPRQLENHHFALAGDTGTGKSNLMLQMARQVRERGESAVVYDPEREFVGELYDPETDVILNPFDERCPAWNPADEVVAEGEAMALSEAVFPDRYRGRSEEPFFIQGARRVYQALLERKPGVGEMWEWIATADRCIDGLVKGTELESLLSAKAYPQRAGVLGVLSRANQVWEPLRRVEGRPTKWSAEKWATEGSGFMFITSTPANADLLRPLITLALDTTIMKLRKRDRAKARPVWLFVDEVASLQTLPQLPTVLTMTRKANMRIVLGMQNRAQMEEQYAGQAETIMSQPATKIILRLSDPRSAEWGSKLIGDQETEDQRESRSKGRGERRSASTDIHMRPAIMPAEIQNLPDCEGILKIPGYAVRLRFPYVAGIATHEGFIRREAEAKPLAGSATGGNGAPAVERPVF